MDKKFGKTLFLVASPFQCLCMFEAIEYFKIHDYDVLVTYSDNFSIGKVEMLLNENNIRFSKIKVSHLFFGVIPVLFSKHKFYKNIFIGYLYSESTKALAYIFAAFKAKIFILDDGTQALSFFSSSPRKITYKFSIKLVLFFYKILAFVKLLKKPIFFTIFNVTSKKYEIVNNPFVLLKSRRIEGEKKGVYIIGTNSSKLKLKDLAYEHYLKALCNNIIQRYPDEKIFYCPHRGDQNLEIIYSQCAKLNIDIFETEIAVEYDFIENNIFPKLIVGFTSNALYTLQILFDETAVETVEYTLASKDDDNETMIIRGRMNEVGINTVKVI